MLIGMRVVIELMKAPVLPPQPLGSKAMESPSSPRRDPATAAFFAIAATWGLTPNEERRLLGDPSPAVLAALRRGDRDLVSDDQLRRISYVLGIYRALQLLHTDTRQADAWIRKPNTAFGSGDCSALDRMLAGTINDIAAVRQYLDAQLGE